MNVYLLRAGSCEVNGMHLSATGRQAIRAIGRKAHLTFALAFSQVIASPLPPCVQSAELFAERTDYLGVIELWHEITAGVPAQVIARKVAAMATQAITSAPPSVLLVADEPTLAALGAALIGRPTFPQSQHAQLSLLQRGTPIWFFRADAEAQAPLLVA